MRLNLLEAATPVITKTLYSPAAIEITYPNGDKWEYIIYDDRILRDLLRKYKRNVGLLISKLRNFESRKISGDRFAMKNIT